MRIAQISSGQVASSVWSNVTRTLTGFSSGAFQVATQAQATLANGTTLDLRTTGGATRTREITVAVTGAGTGAINLWDGTNAYVLASWNNNAVNYAATSTDSTVGIRLNNSGASSATYMYSLHEWVQ